MLNNKDFTNNLSKQDHNSTRNNMGLQQVQLNNIQQLQHLM